jgi:hypothetical protein
MTRCRREMLSPLLPHSSTGNGMDDKRIQFSDDEQTLGAECICEI